MCLNWNTVNRSSCTGLSLICKFHFLYSCMCANTSVNMVKTRLVWSGFQLSSMGSIENIPVVEAPL